MSDNPYKGYRRKLIKDLAITTSLVASRAQAASSGRPNILYLHSHDTGRYIQPYGYAVRTPNLQKFAEESVLFRQAFRCRFHVLAEQSGAFDGRVLLCRVNCSSTPFWIRMNREIWRLSPPALPFWRT